MLSVSCCLLLLLLLLHGSYSYFLTASGYNTARATCRHVRTRYQVCVACLRSAYSSCCSQRPHASLSLSLAVDLTTPPPFSTCFPTLSRSFVCFLLHSFSRSERPAQLNAAAQARRRACP